MVPVVLVLFFFNAPPTTEIYTLSLHDALPISSHNSDSTPASRTSRKPSARDAGRNTRTPFCSSRSEEHTSELQSRRDLVCRLLLEKKNKQPKPDHDRSPPSPPSSSKRLHGPTI